MLNKWAERFLKKNDYKEIKKVWIRFRGNEMMNRAYLYYYWVSIMLCGVPKSYAVKCLFFCFPSSKK